MQPSEALITSNFSTHTSINNEKETRNENEINRLYLILSAIWAGTNGAVIAEAMNIKMPWIMHITPIFLLSNWIIFPFKPHEGLSDDKMTKMEKICRVSNYAINFLFFSSSAWLINQFVLHLDEDSYSSSITASLYCVQTALLTLNFLACYGLQNQTLSSKRIHCITNAKAIFDWITKGGRDIFHSLTKKTLKFARYQTINNASENRINQLKLDIAELKQNNRICSDWLACIKAFVESDCELIVSFKECVRHTQDILLSSSVKDNSQPVDNPLAEEWRQQMLQASYLESLKTRVNDFLEKNPDFYIALQNKLSEQAQPSVSSSGSMNSDE